jgi:hypothetical protein
MVVEVVVMAECGVEVNLRAGQGGGAVAALVAAR